MLKRDEIFKDTHERMLKSEARVVELEESLTLFVKDFESLA